MDSLMSDLNISSIVFVLGGDWCIRFGKFDESLNEGKYADVSKEIAKEKEALAKYKEKLENASDEEKEQLDIDISDCEERIRDLEGELAEIRYVDNGSADDYNGYESLKESRENGFSARVRNCIKDYLDAQGYSYKNKDVEELADIYEDTVDWDDEGNPISGTSIDEINDWVRHTNEIDNLLGESLKEEDLSNEDISTLEKQLDNIENKLDSLDEVFIVDDILALLGGSLVSFIISSVAGGFIWDRVKGFGGRIGKKILSLYHKFIKKAKPEDVEKLDDIIKDKINDSDKLDDEQRRDAFDALNQLKLQVESLNEDNHDGDKKDIIEYGIVYINHDDSDERGDIFETEDKAREFAKGIDKEKYNGYRIMKITSHEDNGERIYDDEICVGSEDFDESLKESSEPIKDIPQKEALKKALERFDENGKIAHLKPWKIARGGYDLAFQLYYNDLAVLDGINDGLGPTEIHLDQEVYNGYDARTLAEFVASVYPDCEIVDESLKEDKEDKKEIFSNIIETLKSEKEYKITLDNGNKLYAKIVGQGKGNDLQYDFYILDKNGKELENGQVDFNAFEDEIYSTYEYVLNCGLDESLKESQEGFTTFLNLECGVLLKEGHPEFKYYSVAYDHKHGYYDETYLNGLEEDLDELKEGGMHYIKNGVNGTYAILTKVDVQGSMEDDFIQDAIKNIEDGMYIDNSIEFLDGEQFKASNVIWSAYKDDNGEIHENFIDTTVKESKEYDDEIIVKK